MYEETYRTNKSIPEWSTMIILSLVLMFNIISISIVLDIPIVDYGKIAVFILLTIILIFNYLYFINDKRYKKIIKHFGNKEIPSFYNYLVLFYEIMSFFVVGLLIGLNFFQALILIAIISSIKILAYSFYFIKKKLNS